MTAAELVHSVKEVQWCKMVNEGNVQGLADLYTTDCKVLPPNAPPLIGRDAFTPYAGALIAAGLKASATSEEIQPGADRTSDGDTFWERGQAELKTDQGGTSNVKYMVVWKRVEGTIKLYTEIWNSNSPQ